MKLVTGKLLAFGVITGALVTATALGGCSGARSRKVLSIFLDGVPQGGPTVNEADSASRAALQIKRRRLAERARNDSLFAANFTLHPPYKDNECTSCHDMPERKMESGASGMPTLSLSKASGKGWLVMPPEELCFECHDDKTAEYAEENNMMIHSPVEDGECLECHDPHRSPNKFLLKAAKVRTLCFECHDETIAEGEDDHPELDDDEQCTDCHNPHLTEDEFLLK